MAKMIVILDVDALVNPEMYLRGVIEVGDSDQWIQIHEILQVEPDPARSDETHPKQIKAEVWFVAEMPNDEIEGDAVADEITRRLILVVGALGAPIYQGSVTVPDWEERTQKGGE